jgi:capsular exopolysaccharide synthesis family protein
MEPKELISLYRRWIWLVIAGMILGLASGFFASKMQTPIYEASAKVLVTRSRQQGGTDVLSISDQQLVLTYLQLLKTRPVLKEVESKLSTKIDADNITVDIVADTQIIQIKVQNKSADQAFAIANSLVQILIEQNETLYAGRYSAYEEGLNSQITQVEKQISTLQGQITQINQANVEEQLNLVNQQTTDLQAEISNLEKDIAKFPSILSAVDRARLTEKQNQLDQLRSLLTLYQQIKTNLTYIGKPVQAGSGLDDLRVTSLQSTLNLYQQLYLNLLNNLTAMKLARVQSTPTVSPIEEAVIPKRPIRPVPLLYTGLAGLVGLIVAAGAIVLIDYLDDTIKSSRKIQDVLGVPVIGEISETIPNNKVRNFRSADYSTSSLLNAFGILRINVSRLVTEKSLKTILITSPSLGEGKTTIATNLASAFVRSGQKVILIDGDLYHPTLHSRLGLDNQKGLTDILAKNLDWENATRNFGGITILTSGAQTSTSAVLLESDGMTKLLDQLEKQFDLIIVDGPPLFVEDSLIMASKVGGILLVVRQGGTITASARAMLDQLNLIGASVLGVALNRVPRADTYYFDGYYHDNQDGKLEEQRKKVGTAQS